LPLFSLLPALRKSVAVAFLSAIGPAVALWLYGPYPENFVMPLALGGGIGLIGFVAGVMFFQHPLKEEFTVIWSKVRRPVV
jgi:hypothetical protein